MKIIFLGPPGAGKGTQAAKICSEYGLAQLSTGDILRINRNNGTNLGIKAMSYMQDGNLVPDDIVIEMLKEEIIKPEYQNGYILDGFPRTVPQAEALDMLLENLGQKLDAVLVLIVPNDELVIRLSGRRTCRTCPATFHLLYNPPKVEGICDFCGGELYQRTDDEEDSIRNRLMIYERQTKPLVDYYTKEELTRIINGMGDINEIFEQIKLVLG